MAFALQGPPHLSRARGMADYAPAVRIVRVEKNTCQRIIEWLGSFFSRITCNYEARREIRSLFKGRVEHWKQNNNPSAAKAVTLIQRFLTGEKVGGLQKSFFEDSGITTTKLMDSNYLDETLLGDPAVYIASEKERLKTYCAQLLGQAIMEVRMKIPTISTPGEEVSADYYALMPISQIQNVIDECQNKPELINCLRVLEQIVSLKEMDGDDLDEELRAHYLGSLGIHEQITLKALPKNALMQGELRALEILSQQLAEENPRMNRIDLKRVQRFLDAVKNNGELNERLVRYQDAQHMTVVNSALEIALDLSFKLSLEDSYVSVMQKVDVLSGKLKQKEETTPEERLSLKEIKRVESLARLHEKFAQLERIGLPQDHKLVELARSADAFVQGVLWNAEKERPQKSGTFIFYDFPNADAYLNWPGGFLRKFIYRRLLRWPLVHTAVGIREKGENHLSHMYHGRHALMRRSIGEYAFKTFEIDFQKVISDEGKEVLKAKLGDNWEQQVEAVFEEIAHRIHTNKEALSQFYNPALRQVFAAVSIGYSIFDNRAMEHRQLSKQQICSSFVLNTSLVALTRLEERIKEECNMVNMDGKELLPASFRFLKLPIGKNRVLDFVLPHQLAERGLPLAREIDVPATIKQVINFHEFEMK